jgi:hypothetical protein
MALKMAASKATERVLYRLQSFTKADAFYDVDPQAATCTCPAYEANGHCKHMEAVGVWAHKPFTPKTHPTFSQALCGLVKSLRVRNLPEAVYWLVYLDSPEFRGDRQSRFRVARRLLIGSAEDGLSIAVMRKVVDTFPRNLKPETPLIYLVAEAARICKLPNWWAPETEGHAYIYDSMVGQRRWWYTQWNHKPEMLASKIREWIELGDTQRAIGAVMAAPSCKPSLSSLEVAKLLHQIAMESPDAPGSEEARRLTRIHLDAKAALASDNNFLCQAAWYLAGGGSPLRDAIEPVLGGECKALLEAAQAAWQTPHPIPTWACDGVHCAGNDTRFMGYLVPMWAACLAARHYGTLDPSKPWRPEWSQHFDGLQIKRLTITEKN